MRKSDTAKWDQMLEGTGGGLAYNEAKTALCWRGSAGWMGDSEERCEAALSGESTAGSAVETAHIKVQMAEECCVAWSDGWSVAWPA